MVYNIHRSNRLQLRPRPDILAACMYKILFNVTGDCSLQGLSPALFFFCDSMFKTMTPGMAKRMAWSLCANLSFISLFPSKAKERLFCQTPWPLWAPLLRAWIKPFEKEIFYINGQPSNKLLQSSLPNHLVSHGELASTSAPSLLLFPPSSSSLEADTRGRWAGEQSAGQAEPSNA